MWKNGGCHENIWKLNSVNMAENKTSVLLVSPLTSNVVGGITKWTNNVYNYYKMAGESNITLIPCYIQGLKNTLGKECFMSRFRKGLNNYFPLIKKIRKELNNSRIDVVHICTSASLGLIKDLVIIGLAKKYRKSVVVHFHFGRIPAIFNHSYWERLLIRQVIERSDKQVVMDMASYNVLVEQGYKNVCYIPNPLSLDVEKCVDQYNNVERLPNIILFVGQMLQTKGIYELAEACSDIPNIEVHYIGPLPNAGVKAKLMTLIDGSKLVLHGSMPFESVIKAMKTAAIFVLPTYSEGFPNVIIESMACACPIVTTPVGAIPEMLNWNSEEKCGICVPVQDVVKLKDAINYMLSNPANAFKMGCLAKKRVFEMYSIQKVWRQLDKLWLSCTRSNSSNC